MRWKSIQVVLLFFFVGGGYKLRIMQIPTYYYIDDGMKGKQKMLIILREEEGTNFLFPQRTEQLGKHFFSTICISKYLANALNPSLSISAQLYGFL